MKNISIKPSKENLKSNVIIGSFLLLVGFLDVLSNKFI